MDRRLQGGLPGGDEDALAPSSASRALRTEGLTMTVAGLGTGYWAATTTCTAVVRTAYAAVAAALPLSPQTPLLMAALPPPPAGEAVAMAAPGASPTSHAVGTPQAAYDSVPWGMMDDLHVPECPTTTGADYSIHPGLPLMSNVHL
ncbi:hypothetical protein MMPV_002892 [Pyropia vietnamensis]